MKTSIRMIFALVLALVIKQTTKLKAHTPPVVIETAQPKKKKIAIAWSKGGGAHKAMLDALNDYLKDEYELAPFKPLEDTLASLDPVRTVTFNYLDGEAFYNFLLAHNHSWVINKLFNLGIGYFQRNNQRIEELLEEYLAQSKPDLLISVIPHLNSPLGRVAEKLKIPFLLIAPDLDISNYHLCELSSEYFNCTVPFDHPMVWDKCAQSRLNLQAIKCCGFPLRPSFFEEKNHELIRSQFGIPSDKKVVMIMMGGTGSAKTLNYLKKLKQLDVPAHLIVCIGKQENMRKTIKKMKFPPHVTLSVVGFTNQISDLMAVSDLLISKPGPTSLCEAIQMRLPILLDNTSTTLVLERMHIEFIRKNKLGIVVESLRDVKHSVTRLITDDRIREIVRERMARYAHNAFPSSIKRLIAQIIIDDEERRKSLNVVEGSIDGHTSHCVPAAA